MDENIFISSNENQKRYIVLEINKKLLWSLVPMIKPEYCKVSIKFLTQKKLVSIKYDKQTKLSYTYIYIYRSIYIDTHVCERETFVFQVFKNNCVN